MCSCSAFRFATKREIGWSLGGAGFILDGQIGYESSVVRDRACLDLWKRWSNGGDAQRPLCETLSNEFILLYRLILSPPEAEGEAQTLQIGGDGKSLL